MDKWLLDRADENLPKLFQREVCAKQTVDIVSDDTAFFGAAAVPSGDGLPSRLRTGHRFILDFGSHLVGYLSFRFRHVTQYLDAPVRLKLRFAEIPYELWRDFDSYHGTLCHTWLQEEIINLDDPGLVELPRRYAFRYLEVTVLGTPREVMLTDFSVRAVTSADWNHFVPLPAGTDETLVKIDAVAARTLAECMQTAYEDGPKRDRRLWSGDLRLQALTDYYLFKNDRLARRCLYLFAACEEPGRYLPGCLYQKPGVFFDDGMGITDYALLVTVSLCDYFEHTGDEATTRELFPVARRQVEYALSLRDQNGILTFPGAGWDHFIDWAAGLEYTTACQGVLLYALERMAALAESLGESGLARQWTYDLEKGRVAARKYLFCEEKGCFRNSYDNDSYLVHAQVWMILGGVICGEEGRAALLDALASGEAVKPVTPYMHHYVMEAMVKLGMMDEALAFMKGYWGGMVEKGADTFWEIYVPTDAATTCYNDCVINSFCHAWSCSASYFIRKYFVKW